MAFTEWTRWKGNLTKNWISWPCLSLQLVVLFFLRLFALWLISQYQACRIIQKLGLSRDPNEELAKIKSGLNVEYVCILQTWNFEIWYNPIKVIKNWSRNTFIWSSWSEVARSEWFIIIFVIIIFQDNFLISQDVLTCEYLFCSTTNLEICLALQTTWGRECWLVGEWFSFSR